MGFGGIPYGLDAPANLKISQYGRKKNQNRYAEHNEKGVHFLTVALEARAPTTRRLYTLAGRTALANYRVSLPNYEFFWGRDSSTAMGWVMIGFAPPVASSRLYRCRH